MTIRRYVQKCSTYWTYWNVSNSFTHGKTSVKKQLANKLTLLYNISAAVLSRNLIISLGAWNTKSVSGSKWLKIIELVTCILFFLLVLFFFFFFTIMGVFSQVIDLLSLSLSISTSHPAPIISSSQRDSGSYRWVCGCWLSGRRGLHQPP